MNQTQAGENSFPSGAAQNGIAEVIVSNLALSKTGNKDVRNFSEMMITHHSHANVQLAELAQGEKGMSIPVMPSQEQMQAVQHLQGLTGAEFDRAYMQHQLQAHEKAIKLFEGGVRSAQDPELRSFAQMGLTLIQAHQQIARNVAETVGATATGSTGQAGTHGSSATSGGTGQTKH